MTDGFLWWFMINRKLVNKLVDKGQQPTISVGDTLLVFLSFRFIPKIHQTNVLFHLMGKAVLWEVILQEGSRRIFRAMDELTLWECDQRCCAKVIGNLYPMYASFRVGVSAMVEYLPELICNLMQNCLWELPHSQGSTWNDPEECKKEKYMLILVVAVAIGNND